LSFAPSPQASLDLYRNGLLMKSGADYNLSSNVVTFISASTPQSGDLLLANYRYANPSNPLGSLTSAQVVCSGTGSSTSTTSLNQLGSCTLPAGLLGAGDRIEIQFQYSHAGTSIGFTGEIHWGGSTVFSRTASSSDAGLSGRITLGLVSGAQSWDAQSWGSAAALAASLGSSAEDITQNITVSLRGAMSGATSDSMILKNFTVIRYPTQTNP